MSRRCLICANVNPCRKHSYDEQDAELARNDRAIRELKATPEAPMTDTLERREAIEAAVKSAIGRALRAELDPTLGRSLEYRTAERAKAVDEATDKIAALTTSPRVDEGRTLCREGIVAFSADIENPRVLKLHFDQDVTSAHRALILEAINARRAALATTPADPRADEEPWAWGWYERGGTKRAYPYLPTVDYPREPECDPFPLYRAADPRVGKIEAALSDPNAVHVNMLRGTIAKPSPAQIWHIYGDTLLADMPDDVRATLNTLSGGR
jgi:hypothetical protein